MSGFDFDQAEELAWLKFLDGGVASGFRSRDTAIACSVDAICNGKSLRMFWDAAFEAGVLAAVEHAKAIDER